MKDLGIFLLLGFSKLKVVSRDSRWGCELRSFRSLMSEILMKFQDYTQTVKNKKIYPYCAII